MTYNIQPKCMRWRLKGVLLVLIIVSALAIFPVTVQPGANDRPHMDYLHVTNYGNPDTEFAALEAESIKIGVIGPMAWMQGQGMTEGAEIARDEINVGGGILGRDVELVFADTLRGQQYPDGGTGATAATELVDAGCDFVIGGYWNNSVSAAREVFMDYNTIFLITGAADDELIEDVQGNYARYKYLFRVAPVNLTTLARTLWAFSQFVLGSKLRHLFGGEGVPDEQVRVAVVSQDLTLWDEMHEYMTNPAIYPYVLGPYANVTYSARVNVIETDFSTILENVNASGARLLFHLFSTQAGTNFTKQWAESGVKAIPVGINVEAQKNEFWEETEEKCEYETILAPTGTRTPTSPEALTFCDETFSRYGHAPIYTSWGAYDAMYTLVEAVGRAGTIDSDSVVSELEQTDRNGILGKFKFTEYHDVFCNEIGANWIEGYVRPMVVQWQKRPRTGEARLEVVWPQDQVYSRKWRIPTWIYSLAETDFNCDGIVNIYDLVSLALSYGTRAGDPDWNPDCDIDGNGIINMVDAARFAKDWGKTASSLSLKMIGAPVEIGSSNPAITQMDSTTMIYLDPPTINGTTIDQEFTVEMNIRDAVNVTTWEASIAFNATLLECIDVGLGSFLEISGAELFDRIGEINNTSGEITGFGRSVLGNHSASGDGTLAYATFRVKQTGISDLHLRDTIVIDYWGAEVMMMTLFNIIDVYTVTRSAAQTVFIVSNSTGVDEIEYVWFGSGFYDHGFNRPLEETSFKVKGPYSGFSNVTIPKTLIEVDVLDQLLVVINDTPLETEERIVTENATHYFVYFDYTLGIHNVRILKRPPVRNIITGQYYERIQKAINSAQPGQKILAFAGTHYENVVVNKSLSLIGENKHNTTIDGSGGGTVIEVTANNVKISNFTIQNSGNPEYGILVDGSNNNIINNNIITNNHIGICLHNSSGNTLANNNISGNEYNFGLYGAVDAHFDNTIDMSNTVEGKPVYYVKKASNTVYDSSTNVGTLYLIDCTNVTIGNLTLTKNVNGVFLWNTTNSNVQNVTVSNNLNGIILQGQSNYNNLVDNIISNNTLGIYLDSSNNSVIYHNSFIENTIQANVTASYNTLWDYGYPSGGNYWSDHSIEYPFVVDEYKGVNQDVQGNDGIIDDPKVIDEENQDNYPLVSPLIPPVYNLDTHLGYTTIQAAIDSLQTSNRHRIIVRSGTYSEQVIVDKPLTLIGIMGSTIINGAGTTVTITADYVTLRGFTIQGSGSTDKGILLSNVNNVVISENTITKKGYGIWLDHSDNCTISGNTINNNTEEGIHLESSGSAIISRNTLNNSLHGIYFFESSNNDIHRNNVTGNTWGIDLYRSSDNIIYHNNFTNNTDQTYLYQSSNTWDDGYPSGGNYWSDYEDRYPDAEEIDGSGIWNTPYVLDENNQDNYPLMSPPSPQHDVAVVSVTPSKTVVGQGYSINITVTFQNQGDYVEKFNATLSIPTWAQTITLTSENSVTITFTWDTTGWAKGNYTISANATIVTGETDISDNSYTDGTVRVNMVGDVAPAYGEVDIVDVVYVAIHFGAEKEKPPPPNTQPYEANADVNGDGIIDIVDIVTVAIHFGEKDP